MKHQIVSDGAQRLLGSPELQTRLRELRQTIRARHAAELAEAGFLWKLFLRWQIAVEFRRERRKLVSSAHSLYSNRIAA